jgi:hypothetical protein
LDFRQKKTHYALFQDDMTFIHGSLEQVQIPLSYIKP